MKEKLFRLLLLGLFLIPFIFTSGLVAQEIDKIVIISPPTPPPGYERIPVELPEPNIAEGINVLANVPAFDWSYGCSATSASMISGYYDRTSHRYMYTGPTNGGVMPMDNSAWGVMAGECPLSATHRAFDGRTILGHVDDYWIAYGNPGPDPFIGNWTEHNYGDCTGDYMKTNQSNYGNSDGSTTFYYFTNGAPIYWYDMEGYGIHIYDGGYGHKLFYESRGYTVTNMYNQYIIELGLAYGFTYDQYKAEIDAGRPVMIHIEGHTMVGLGYDDANNLMYIHDTWDYNTYTMTWAGSYAGMQHYGVTIVQLSSEDIDLDFGDLIGKPTFLAENGPSHATQHLWLGDIVDLEPDSRGYENDNPTDDGVTFLGSGPVGGPYTLPYKATDPEGAIMVYVNGDGIITHAYVSAWFDQNHDCDFSDALDYIVNDALVSVFSSYIYTFAIDPNMPAGDAPFRIRVSPTPLGSSGYVDYVYDGEVEDYLVEGATEGVHVVIPDTIGTPGTLVDIPMKVITDVTGMGIIAAEIELSWDVMVLDNASAAPGAMVPPGWLFNYTSASGSGQMTIWMAGTEENPPTDDLAGTGSLVKLTFDVVGQHCDTTIIHFDKMIFNEGDPLAITHDGWFHAFAGWDITGHIYYCLNNAPVDEVRVPAVGTSFFDITDVNGDYELLDLPPNDYVVKPEKEDDLGSPVAISAYDAAWILQYGVGSRTFTPCQMIAADVSGNGSVAAFDAAKILQWGVGIITHFPVMPDSTHYWTFVPDDFALNLGNWMTAPDSIAYTPLNNNEVDDYKAILYGDVSGNWQPTDAGLAKSAIATVDIRLENVGGKSGDRISVPMYLDNASDIIAMNFTLAYNPEVLKAVGASLTTLTHDYLIAHAVKDGQIRVGLAGSQPIVGSGAVVNLEFEVLDTESPDATSLMEITQMVINDGSIAANIEAARFEMGSPVPDEYALHQNYPNPFNPETMIKYQLPKSGKVVLRIYNSLGQEIRTLINEEKEAGYHEARWDGRDNIGISVSSGIYIYRFQAGDFVSSKKMIFMR